MRNLKKRGTSPALSKLEKESQTSLPIPPSYPFPPPWHENFLIAYLHSDIILFAKRSILIVWQYSEYASVSITAQYFVQWPYTISSIRHIQNSGIFSTLFFWGICHQVQSHSLLLKHIDAYWDIAKAYSDLLTQAYSAHCDRRIFTILSYF